MRLFLGRLKEHCVLGSRIADVGGLREAGGRETGSQQEAGVG